MANTFLYIFEDDYAAVDAAIEPWLRESDPEIKITRRRQLSAGSVEYQISIVDIVPATIIIRHLGMGRIILRVTIPQLPPDGAVARTILTRFIQWRKKDKEQPVSPALTNEISAIDLSEATYQRSSTHEPPSPNASIDAWLDWRDRELERNRPPHSVSFRRLAELSKKYSESQFKHRRRDRRSKK